MTLPASGPISFNAINLELGLSGTANRSLNSSDYRTLAGVASGLIDLQDFYGKSNITYGLVNGTIIDGQFGTATASYTLDNAGTISASDASSAGHGSNWVTPTAQASSHEVRATIISGALDGSATGTWLAGSTTRTWSVTEAVQYNSTIVSFTIEVRDTATSTIRDTATITLQADSL